MMQEIDLLNVMNTAAKRIRVLMTEDGINQKELAEKVERAQSLISSYLKSEDEISDTFLLHLQDKLGWSVTWLRTGVGPKRVSYKPSNQLGEELRSYSPYNAQERDNGGRNNMWIVPAKAQAGFARNFEHRMFSRQIQKVSFPMIQGECFCFEIEGFSMYPEYTPGNFVISTLIEDWSWLRKGKVYVFQTDDGIIIKHFENVVDETVYMSSSNPTHNPVDPISLTDLRQVYNIEFKVERPQG